MVQWRARGTFDGGPFQGLHPTGRPVEVRGCDVMEFEGEKIRHMTKIWNSGWALKELGWA